MNKKHTTGYKGMLRDRVPATVNLALKWCEAKTKWIDLVYNQSVKFCVKKELKDSQCRHILGISNKKRGFEFHDTIEWDKLSETDTIYWKKVEGWVNWFTKNMIPIQELFKQYTQYPPDVAKFKKEAKRLYMNSLNEELQEKLTNVIIEHIIYMT